MYYERDTDGNLNSMGNVCDTGPKHNKANRVHNVCTGAVPAMTYHESIFGILNISHYNVEQHQINLIFPMCVQAISYFCLLEFQINRIVTLK